MVKSRIWMVIVLLLVLSAFLLYRENLLPTARIPAESAAKEEYTALEMAEQFLLTKTTSDQGLGCGPPDDFDCGVNRYSGYMALSNLEAYRMTGNQKYLDYAISFAMAEQARDTEPPDWCPTCTCNPPDDFECGSGEVQAEMIQVFARLYQITGNQDYLDYAERFAQTVPISTAVGCEDCSCGPPDDFDCGAAYAQIGYLEAYSQMYAATQDTLYLEYARGLGDAWMGKTVKDKGAALVEMYWSLHQLTGDQKYRDHALEMGSQMLLDWREGISGPSWNQKAIHAFDETAYIRSFSIMYGATGDESYLKAIEVLAQEADQCEDGVCKDNVLQQGFMIQLNLDLYDLTGDKSYMENAETYALMENIEAVQSNVFGYTTSCDGFDCHDAEDNAYLASAFLRLASAREESASQTND